VRERFDVGFLDPVEPFELDPGNRPHLFKHVEAVGSHWIAFGEEDLRDVYLSDRTQFYPASEEGDAHWLMVGEIPGGPVLVIPLAPPNSGDVTQCRPIGIYSADRDLRATYLQDAERKYRP